MHTVHSVVERLMNTPGVVACWVLPDEERGSLRRLEMESNLRLGLPGLEIVSEGIKDVLERQHVVVISHSPALRHPPGPVVVIRDEEGIVGEEIWEPSRLEKVPTDPIAILLGKSLVLYRDALTRARGKPLKLAYRALPFPELEDLVGVRDVISVTVGIATHLHLARKAGWDLNDPDLGTVLVGFNESTRPTAD